MRDMKRVKSEQHLSYTYMYTYKIFTINFETTTRFVLMLSCHQVLQYMVFS